MTFPHGGSTDIWADTKDGSVYNPTKSEIRDYQAYFESAEARRFESAALLSLDIGMDYAAGAGKTVVTAGQYVQGGNGRYRVADAAATDHHLTTAGGLKLYVEPTSRGEMPAHAWGLVADGDIAAAPGYAPSGTDGAVTLQKAITDTQAAGYNVTLVTGRTFVDGDLTLNVSGDLYDAAGWVLRGNSSMAPVFMQHGYGVGLGDAILMSPGSKITGGIRSMRIENLSIWGVVQDGPLLDLGILSTNGGGLTGVEVMNALESIPTGTPIGMKIAAFYAGRSNTISVHGHRKYRSRWDNGALDSAALFQGYGWGVWCDASGGGSTAGIEGLNVAGWERGFVLEVDPANPDAAIEQTPFHNFQASFCCTGFWGGKGADNITLINPHFEYNTDRDIRWAGGAGTLKIIDGLSSNVPRGPGTAQKKLDASIVCGDPVLAENAFDLVHAKGFSFNVVSNQGAGVLYYGGATEAPGVLILEGCIWTNGTAVMVDTTHGDVCDIWIKGSFDHASQTVMTNYARWITTFTRNGDYTDHTFAPAGHLGRVDGALITLPVLATALSFSGRKIIPYAIKPNTTVGDFTITLSNSVWVGQSMTIVKVFAADKLLIEVPVGTILYDASGAKTEGATATFVFGSIAVFVLEKISETIWTIR